MAMKLLQLVIGEVMHGCKYDYGQLPAELGVTRYQSSALRNNYYIFGVEVI